MKVHQYDLLRFTGKYGRITFLRNVLFQPKYKIVYLKRMCEKYRKNKIAFCFFRLLYEHYMVKYTIDIGSSTEIGPGFIIEHIGGIAINKEVIIGSNVEILQGVTIGSERRGKRKGCPTIGNNIWIGSNAVVVGDITVGDNVLIAANAFVNFDVPSNSIVIGNPGKIIASDHAVDGYVSNTIPDDEIQKLTR